MKKAILALAIFSAISINAQGAVSEEDLMDINAILGEKPSAPSKEQPKTTPKKEVVDQKTKKTSVDKTNSEQTKNPTTDSNKEQPTPVLSGSPSKSDTPVVSKTLPTVVVPVSGSDFIVKVDRYQKKIFKKALSSDELKLSILGNVPSDHKDDKEIVEFVDTVKSNKVAALSNMSIEPSVYLGPDVNIKKGKIEKKEKLGDLKYGYSYIIQIQEFDKKNNRVSLRFDHTVADIDTYTESEGVGADGVLQRFKVPVIKTSNTSKIFWLTLENGKSTTLKIDDINYVDISIGRVMPFVHPVVVVDLKKIEADKIAEEAAKKKAIEDQKIKAAKDEMELYDSLENQLKGKKVEENKP